MEPVPLFKLRSGLALIAALLSAFVLVVTSAQSVTAAPVHVDTRVLNVTAQYGGCFHLVRPGENLFRIGLRYGLSYHYLARLNGLRNPNYIYAGLVLAVPCRPYPPYPLYPPVYPCARAQSYQVQPGDNLFRIAYNFGSAINWIRNANYLWGRVLRPGMVLIVPCPGAVKYRYVPPVGTVIAPTPLPPPPVVVTPLPPSATNIVSMRGSKFDPPVMTIKVGQRVTWRNDEPDGTVHSVVSGAPGAPDGSFSSGANPIAAGQSFTFQFTIPGTYPYFSQQQPNMQGIIVVNQ